jgi:hypothetical protein
MEAKAMDLATVEDIFQGTELEEFVAHFGLFSLKPVLNELDIKTLDKLLLILSDQSLMKELEDRASPVDFETLIGAIQKTDIGAIINEQPIPYTLRSGNKKKSGKRKKQDDDETEDPEVRNFWKKKGNIRGENYSTSITLSSSLHDCTSISLLSSHTARSLSLSPNLNLLFTALHNQLKKAASLDLVLMLDCTGSMFAYLKDIQCHIMSLVDAVGKLHPDSNLRLAFVFDLLKSISIATNIIASKQYKRDCIN